MSSEEPEIKKQKTMSQILRICTHSGSFHADEALAVFMLRLLPKWKDATLKRSRNPEDWENSDIVVDVGATYDGVKFFDHHQRGFTETFNDTFKTKLSSAGLVYKHFGKEIIGEIIDERNDQSVLELLYIKVYKEIIEAIDANDNGINKYANDIDESPRFKDRSITLPSIVANLNPFWNEDNSDESYDRQFLIASEVIGNAFVNVVKNLGLSWLPAKKVVEEAFNKRFETHSSGSILILDQFAPWKDHLYEIEKSHDSFGKTLYVLFADASNNWRISTVPISGGSFENRKPLPENWRGLRDDALSKESGVEGCVFVHAAGFIGGAKTKEAVLKLAELSL
ncbi:hypothetical protein WICMUC_005530 [Wickerhamomyces mucosus]|uniref:Metal-dependent protein hydrolase n=1 Tax=Wickerhamomyces mucosus TaxID=1378264 RepID=A0A9P8P6H7_9ASCO|nr:hypothetical protein WICMUC_005530 [Wickerhamomyces mucosus]